MAGAGFAFGSFETPKIGVGQPSAGLSFGTPASQSNNALSTATPSFGGFGSGVSLGNTTKSTASSLSLAPTVTTTSASAVGLLSSTGFGTPSTNVSKAPVSSAGSIGFNFGANTSTTTSVLGAISNPTTTASAAKIVGLGGVDFSSNPNSSSDGTQVGEKSDGKAVKSTLVPTEISNDAESFKKHIKDQKAVTEEIKRFSSKPMSKVREETDALKQLVSVISSGIHRNAAIVAKLKQESARELKNAEISKQTKDTPASMQYENSAPTEYFQQFVQEVEKRMLTYKQQIEEMEHHLMSLTHSSAVNPHELTVMMKRIHETFVAMAARLHTVHEDVQIQKEKYLNYRKRTFGDARDIFQERTKNSSKVGSYRKSQMPVGPSAFADIPNVAAIAMVTALNRNQQNPAVTSLSLGSVNQPISSSLASGTSNIGASSSLFGPTGSSSLFGSAPSLFGTAQNQAPSFGGGSQFGSGFNQPSMFGGVSTQPPAFGSGTSTGFGGSAFSFGNTSAVRPLGK